MSSFDRFSFYERMYYHELEIKEKITARAQIAFTAIFAIATVSVYILRVLDFSSNPAVVGLIIPWMVGHIVGLLIATRFALQAFWKNWFASMPSATEIFKYEESLRKYNTEVAAYNKAYPENAQALADIEACTLAFLIDRYRISATHNKTVNKRRSDQLHACIRFIFYSTIPLFFSAALFVIFDQDASSPRKSIKINDDAIARELFHLKSTISEVLEMSKKDKEEQKSVKPSPPTMPKAPAVRVALEDFKVKGEQFNEQKTTE